MELHWQARERYNRVTHGFKFKMESYRTALTQFSLLVELHWQAVRTAYGTALDGTALASPRKIQPRDTRL